MFVKLKKGQNVVHVPTKRQGRVIDIKGAYATVEFIIGQNMIEKTRTTKLEDVFIQELVPYEKKRHSYAPYFDVKEFHIKFGHPVPSEPTPITPERATQRTDYLIEEVVEFLWASVAGDEEQTKVLVDKMVDSAYKGMNKCFAKGAFPQEEILLHQTDALNDINYINYGSIVETGVNPKNIFSIIQNANLSKLGADGKPIIDPVTNKILKPEGWEEKHKPEPLIKKEIERQIKLAKGEY